MNRRWRALRTALVAALCLCAALPASGATAPVCTSGGGSGGTGAVQGGGTGGTGRGPEGGGTGGTGAVAQGGGTGGTGAVAKDGGTGGTGTPLADGGIGGTGAPALVAARVHFAAGAALASFPGAPARQLARGDPVCEGEILRTGDGALLQLVTPDAATLVLRGHARLRIDRYVFAGAEDGSERIELMLLEGALRTLTGRIGHLHHEAFVLRTPGASVGVLGTDHETYFLPAGAAAGEPGTYDRVFSGATVLGNAAGTVRVHPREVGFAPLDGARPRLLDRVPAFLATGALHPLRTATAVPSLGPVLTLPGLVQPVFVFGSSQDLQSYLGGLYAAPAGGVYLGMQHSGTDLAVGGVTTGDASGSVLVDGSGLPGAVSATVSGYNYTASPAQLLQRGTVVVDGTPVVWGLYAGGTAFDAGGHPVLQDFHHFVFAPGGGTPDPVVRALSGSATFSTIVAATSPTNELGGVGGQLSLAVQLQLGANAALTDYNLSVVDANARSWTGRFTGSASLSTFASSGVPLAVSCTGAGCGAGIGDTSRSFATGQLLGNSARGLGTTYGLATTTGQVVGGAAVLTRP